jgi:hypothetical protein
VRIQSPVRPSSVNEFIEFNLGVENLKDPNNGGVLVAIPQITMHIAPSNLSFEYKKIIHREKTRGGWFEQHWGEELDAVSATASTGSFSILGIGLTTAQRHNSLAKVNFQEIFYLFKNNACVFDPNGNVISQGEVFIDYDSFKMWGQFDNFSWQETGDSPYKWNFTFSFQVTRSARTI